MAAPTAFSRAEVLKSTYLGIDIAARIPSNTRTAITSIKVKPFGLLVFFLIFIRGIICGLVHDHGKSANLVDHFVFFFL